MSGTLGSPPPAPPGFQLEAQIGQGTFGDVWLGTDRLGARVAIKYFRRGAAPEASGAFWTEGELAAALRTNPNVVSVISGDILEGNLPYLVMDYMARGTLRERLAIQPVLGAGKAVEIGVAVADALAAAHANRILHCDVSTGNILFDDEDRARLADFGLALRVQNTVDGRRPFSGTPPFCAPEVFAGSSGPPSDVWGLGAVLFTALVGVAPFGDGALGDLERRIVNDAPAPLPATLPPALRDVVAACLDKQPADRPTAAEVRSTLESVVAALGRSTASVPGSGRLFTEPEPPDEPDDLDPAQIVYARCLPNVLRLTYDVPGGKASGSGVVISDDGIVATNAHVVRASPSRTIDVFASDGRKTKGTILKRVGSPNDVAFVQIDPTEVGATEPLELLPLSKVSPGAAAYTLGYPRIDRGGTQCSIYPGTVSQLQPDKQDGQITWIRHSADINPGNSGGALADRAGRLIGLNTWLWTDLRGFYFAVDADTVARELELLRAEQQARPHAHYCLACGAWARQGDECANCHQPDEPPPAEDGPAPQQGGGFLAPVARTLGTRQTALDMEALGAMLTHPPDVSSRLIISDPSWPAGAVNPTALQGLASTVNELRLRLFRSSELLGETERRNPPDPLFGDGLVFAASVVGEAVFALRTARVHELSKVPAAALKSTADLAELALSAYLVWSRAAPDARSGPDTYDWWARIIDRELGRLQRVPAVDDDSVTGARLKLWAGNRLRVALDDQRDPAVRKRESALVSVYAIRGHVEAMRQNLAPSGQLRERPARAAFEAAGADLAARAVALDRDADALRTELGVR